MSGLEDLPRLVTAVGGLGAAAFGLVDATKAFGGGVNHIGFRCIRTAVQELLKPAEQRGTGLSEAQILAALQANWMSGTDIEKQKAIAKSLITVKLHSISMDPGFDLVLTAILDEAYERGSQQYRNWTRALAAVFAVAMAVAGGQALAMNPVESLLIGLIATPLAPMAKDLSSALSVAVRR